MKDALAGVIAIGALAVLLVAALVGLGIADSWTPTNTANLITALAVSCGGGFVILALIVGLFLGLGFYRRIQADTQRRSDAPTWRELPPPGWSEPKPPALPALTAGQWVGGGPQAYDLWEQPTETAWRAD